MILVRSPLRITLGGGGTDLPSYASQHGGFCLTAAINQYVYVSVMRPFLPGIYLKYSEQETVARISDVRHPIIREALRFFDIPPQVEITTLADIPAGTGLGSSSSFTTALVKALALFHLHQHLDQRALAEAACAIEIDHLHAPIGKQDQYAAAYGGLQQLVIDPSGLVQVTPLPLPPHTRHQLEDGLLLFFTGYARSATTILRDQPIEQMHIIKALGLKSLGALLAGNLPLFGSTLDEHWQLKRVRSKGITNKAVDRWYNLAMEHGALGGKLVGAGGGGFLLFYTEDPRRLRAGLQGSGLQEVRFRFDVEGTKVVCA